jgi:pimeloyl-ACP methyl ester carboxylesterase
VTGPYHPSIPLLGVLRYDPLVRTEPILLVHGLGSSFEHGWRAPGWADLIADAGRQVIPVDLLGHGTADAPHDPDKYAHLESSIERALPDEQVDAIGFSLGAQLLLRVAARTPERFGRLVVIGVGANLLRDGDTTALADAFERGAEPTDITARLFFNLALSAGNDPLAISACLRRPQERLTAEDLARVSTPTLVIIGDEDFAGPAEPLVEALPNATLAMLKGVDHFRVTSEFGCIDAALEFVEATI